MKKIVVVSSSLKNQSSSEILAKSFINGALSAENEIKFISLKTLKLKYCIGCLSCQSHNKCVLDDEMNELYEVFQEADVLVLATPIYFYSICGQLKTFLDRLNPLFSRENKFKEVYLLTTAADKEESAIDKAVTTVKGWIECFEGVSLKGVLCGTGINDIKDITKSLFIEKAYDLGKSV